MNLELLEIAGITVVFVPITVYLSVKFGVFGFFRGKEIYINWSQRHKELEELDKKDELTPTE